MQETKEFSISQGTGGSTLFVAAVTFAATLGGLLFGYDTAVISGTVKSLHKFFIDNMSSDPEYAHSVLVQYRLVVATVSCIIALIFSGMLFKMFEKKIARNIAAIFLILCIVAIGIFLSQSYQIDENTLNSVKGFTISSALVGCIFGGALAGRISTLLGRRNGLILAAVLFSVSALGSALPDTMNVFITENIISFIIYRIIGGVGVGLASMLTPMFIAEIAPANIRGKLVSWNQFAIIFGMLVIYFVNYFIARGRPDEWLDTIGWRWMFASELIPAILFFVLLFFVPETPRFLMMINHEEKARQVLNKIYPAHLTPQIIHEIHQSFTGSSRRWLHFGSTLIGIGVLLSVFQQFVGINVVLYFAPEIFRTLGSGTDSALFQTILIGAINLLFTVLAIFTVDKIGRKILQITGAIGMAFAMISLGIVFYLQNMGTLALVFMLLYIASFAMSWGPVTWVLLSEIFPNSIRGAMSLAVSAQWIANLMVSWTFPILNDNIWLTEKFHHGFAYWIYGIMSVLAAFFVWRFVPETKGKSLEDIEKIWKKH